MYMLMGYIKIFSKAGHPNLASASASASASAVIGSGIGRGIRRVFGEYFYSRTGIEVANLVTKYQNREGWTIKDVLTLIHIDPKKMKDDGGRLAIEWVFKSKDDFTPIIAAAPTTAEQVKTLFNAIKEIHTIAERPLKPATNPSLTNLSNYQYGEELDRIVHLINQAGLCREQLPSQLFKYRKIWEALLLSKGANGKGKGMPLTALIRNLGKLSTAEIGIIDPKYISPAYASSAYSTNTQWGGVPPTEYIIRRITDAHDIKRTRIHPYTILVAMLTYQKGQGDKGSLVWSPNPNVIKALDKAFKLAFQNITPTGKRIKIALDVSGSMSSAYCTGSPIVSCATASVAMMITTLYVENQRGVPPPNGGNFVRCVAPGVPPPNGGGGDFSAGWMTRPLFVTGPGLLGDVWRDVRWDARTTMAVPDSYATMAPYFRFFFEGNGIISYFIDPEDNGLDGKYIQILKVYDEYNQEVAGSGSGSGSGIPHYTVLWSRGVVWGGYRPPTAERCSINQ
jgi:hypothetical protein